MMKLILFVLGIVAMAAAPALAQSGNQAFCQFLPVREHFVGAEYVPGMDVNGNPVVPADVKAQADGMLDVVKIPVTIDVVQNLQQVLPQGTEMNAQMAMLEIHKDSRVLLNGRDVSAKAYAVCGKEPFNIEAAAVEPAAAPDPETVKVVEPEAVTEGDIIWGKDN